MLKETSTEFCLIAKQLARLGTLCYPYIKLHALNVTFFAQLFLELSDIILSHHYDTLIDKSFIS